MYSHSDNIWNSDHHCSLPSHLIINHFNLSLGRKNVKFCSIFRAFNDIFAWTKERRQIESKKFRCIAASAYFTSKDLYTHKCQNPFKPKLQSWRNRFKISKREWLEKIAKISESNIHKLIKKTFNKEIIIKFIDSNKSPTP